MVKVGLLHSRLRVEERRLQAALEGRGAEVVLLQAQHISFDLHGTGFDGCDLVVERCHDYTLAQTALRALEHRGTPTINRPATVDISGNKLLMSAALIRAGVPTPAVEVALGTTAALEAIERLGYPAVLKPLIGRETELLALIDDREAAEAVLEHKAMLGTERQHVYYVQEYIQHNGRDIRVLVVGDTPLAAEYRQANHWITSRDRRARHEACTVTSEIGDLALRAARAMGGGILEVDILESEQGLLVNEASPITHFRAIETASGQDVAGAIAEHCMRVATGVAGTSRDAST